MKNFIARGDVLTLPTADAVVSGMGVLIGSIFGVAANDAPAGGEVVLNVTGVFELPKASPEAWTPGTPVYWDGLGQTTTVATGNTLIGVAVEAVAGGVADTLGKVRLNGSFGHPDGV